MENRRNRIGVERTRWAGSMERIDTDSDADTDADKDMSGI